MKTFYFEAKVDGRFIAGSIKADSLELAQAAMKYEIGERGEVINVSSTPKILEYFDMSNATMH